MRISDWSSDVGSSDLRHYPYWYEGTRSTRQPLAASEYPCVNPQYRPYYGFTSVYAWGYRSARQTCTLFCNAGMHLAWHASPQPLTQEPDMQPSLPKLPPALAVLTLLIAGCNTPPQTDTAAPPQPPPP